MAMLLQHAELPDHADIRHFYYTLKNDDVHCILLTMV